MCVLSTPVSPVVHSASQMMQINISEPATLACLTTGFPLPSVTWQKDGEEFTANTMGVNIFEFLVCGSDSGSGSSMGVGSGDYMSSGFTGSGSIADLIRLDSSY